MSVEQVVVEKSETFPVICGLFEIPWRNSASMFVNKRQVVVLQRNDWKLEDWGNYLLCS
jgi:hypothetical protein